MRKLACLIALLTVFAALPAAAISFQGIRNQLIQFLLDKVSVEGVFEITAESVVDREGAAGTTLTGVEIADAEGVWFSAEELSFAFDRSALLRGRLVIPDIVFDGVEVIRQPVIPPGEEIEVDLEGTEAPPPAPFVWPRAPITTEIRNLVLRNVHLHQPVLGQEVSFDATGSARDIGDIQAAELHLRRTDEVTGTIDLSYTRDFAANTLKLDLEAVEGTAGLVGYMLDLPGDVPIALEVHADGTPGDYHVAFDLDMTDYLQAQGTAVLDYEGPFRADAEFTATPGPKMPAEYAQVLGDRAELIVKAEEGPDRTVRIETARISSPYLNGSASGSYSRATGAVDLSVDLVAEPGLADPFEGIAFAGLTFTGEIEGEPGSLSADGNLHLAGLSAPVIGVDEATLAIDLAQTGTADAPVTELTVRGDADGLRIDRIGPEVIGDADLELVASLRGDDLTLETARIDSDVLDLAVAGTANVATGDFDVSYRASTPRIGPVLAPYGVEATGTIEASGQLVGQGGVVTVETSADLTDFVYQPVASADRLHLEGTVVAEAERTTFDLKGTGEGLAVGEIPAGVLGRVDLGLNGGIDKDNVLTLENARLSSEVLDATADGTVDLDDSSARLSYRVSSAGIGPAARAYGYDVSGAASATGTVVRDAEGALTLTTDAELTDFASELAAADRLTLAGTVEQAGERIAFDLSGGARGIEIEGVAPDLLDRADFAAKGALDGQELTLETARIDSPVLNGTLEGNLDLGTQVGRIAYDFDSVPLGPLAESYDLSLTGTASAEGVVELPGGDRPAPHVVGSAAVAGFSYGAMAVGDIAAEYDVVLSDAPHGTLEARVTDGALAPARVATAFRLEGRRLVLDGLDLAALGLTAAGDLAVDLEATTAEGTLDIGAADLARLGGLGGGRADGTLRLTVEGGRQNAVLDLAARGLIAGGFAVGTANVKARLTDVLGAARVSADIAAERVVSGDLVLATLTATANGPLSGLELRLNGAGELEGRPLTLAAALRADLTGEAQRATVSRAELTIGQERIALLEPLTVVMRGSVVAIDDMAVALPDNGVLTGELTYFGGPTAGDILLEAPDLSFLSRLFDVPIERGALRLAAEFDTRRGRAHAEATVTGRDLVFSDVSGIGVLTLDGSLDWDGRIASIDARLGGSFGEPLVLEATLPVRAGGTLPELAESGPVSARLNWAGEIGDLWALVPVPNQVVTGQAEIDIGVTGDISRPVFTGGLRIADGTYQHLDAGTILTDVSLATNIESDGALGIRLDAVDGAKGTVRVEGRIGFGDQGVDLTVETRNAVLVRRDDAVARVVADLHIFGPFTQLAVVGDVRIPEAEIRLLLDNPPEIVTLGDVRIKGEPVVEDEGPSMGLPVRLDIDVSSAGGIWVRGRGLDSEWRVNLHVGGDIEEPRITGQVEALRGELDLLGKQFDLQRGLVVFGGGAEIDPRLDVELVRETTDITGGIFVSGTASEPELRFASTPALPESEVLPHILFGKPAEALTAAQGIQLALGLATLLNGGAGTLDRVRSAVGLDTLDIEQDESGGTELSVGKQVSDRVWLGSKQSLTEGGTSVAVEVEVFGNVTVDGEVESDGDSSVGVFWKKDF